MDITYLYVIGIVFLLVLSGFFSGSETGLTAVSKGKIHRLKRAGNKRAGLVSYLRKDKDRLIGALLLGNNAVNILASALATSLAIQWYGEQGVAYATLVMTLLVLVFAEVLPKTYAFRNAEKVAIRVAPVLSVLVKLFAPITGLVQYAVSALLNMLGSSKKIEEGDEVSVFDEIRGSIELHHDEGRFEKREKDMLGSILDLQQMEVEEVMVHRKHIVAIDLATPVSKIVNQVMASSHTRHPLYRDSAENIVGVLHTRDLLRAIREKGEEDVIISELANEPWFVPETTALDRQLVAFRQRHQHLALVIDEYGDLTGLVTLEDILEEIVGHIYDEHDQSFPGVKKLKDGGVFVEGETTLRDLNRSMEWSLPDEDATTIAGLVIHVAQSIPDPGDEFTLGDFHFKVIKKRKNQITRVRVQHFPPAQEEGQ